MAKHINSLNVQNFRCLKDFKIENFGDVNLLVGKNNSGKTTVLEAVQIYVHPDPIFLLKDLAIQKNYIIDKYIKPDFISKFFSRGNSNCQKIIFAQNSTLDNSLEICYGYSIDGKEFKEKIDHYTNNIQEAMRLKYNNPNEETVLFNVSDDVKTVYQKNLLKNPYEKDGVFLDSNTYNNLPSITELSSLWDRVKHIKDYKKHILQVLALIEPNIEDFDFYNFEYDTRFRYVKFILNNHSEPVSMFSMGDGITRSLVILICLSTCKNGIFLIDEFENGLHFSVQKKLWEVLFKVADDLKIQIFATTHSRDTIQALAEVSKENTRLDGALFRVGTSMKDSNKGEIIATYFSEDRLSELLQSDFEVR